MSAYWPVVQARLVELLPTILPAGVVVFDGPRAGREKGAKQHATVGATSDGGGGTYEQPDSTTDTVREERGEVECEFVDWSGDENSISTRRSEVFAWADALEASVRADQTLGVLPNGSTTTLSGALDLTATKAALVVTVSYFVPAAP